MTYISIIVAAVVAQIVGFIWWGPIFGKKWAELMGISAKEMKKRKEKIAKPMVVFFIVHLVMAYVISMLITTTGAANMSAALGLAFWIWLGLVATTQVEGVLTENKPQKLYWINSIGWLVTIAAITISLTLI